MEIKERVGKIIDQKRTRLKKERAEYEQKLRDTRSYYGVGGPYRRQEAAIEARNQKLSELDDFEKQLNETTKHIKTRLWFFKCNSCGAICMTTLKPFSDWHECPTCRNMIYLNNIKDKVVRIADDGGIWFDLLKEANEVERNEIN